MKQRSSGICRLCGEHRKLTFEHIPPRSAFNNHAIVFQTMQDLLEGHSHSKFPKGVGKHSLCDACNSKTGGWYGEAFSEWSRQGLEWLTASSETRRLALPYEITPLSVIKQVLVMALAMTPEASVNYHTELRDFLLNREQKYIPLKYRVFTYLNIDGRPRFASGMAVMRVDVGSMDYIEAEVAMPPFGYCVTSTKTRVKSLAEFQGLCDITWFSKFEYNQCVNLKLRIPSQETHEPLPLDYRTKLEIEEHRNSDAEVRTLLKDSE